MGLISKKNTTSAGKLFGANRIYGVEGDHETPYMTRFWFGRLRFHIFHRGDADPDCHDHPWGFWTFPLRPYIEEVLEPRIETVWTHEGKVVRPYFERRRQVLKAFRWHYRPATHTHRVLGLAVRSPHTTVDNHWSFESVANIPTIVWRERPSRAWGFTKNDQTGKWCWVSWKTYVYGGGKEALCKDE